METSKPSGTDVAPVPTLEQLDAANETLKFLSQSMDIQALLRESSLTKIQGQGQDVRTVSFFLLFFKPIFRNFFALKSISLPFMLLSLKRSPIGL